MSSAPPQHALLDAVTTNSTGPAKDIRNITAYSVFVKSVGGTSAAVVFEGTADPAGVLGWAPIGQRITPGVGVYDAGAEAITPAAPFCAYFDPSDNVLWIRAVVSAQVGGTAVTAILNGES